MMYDNATGKNKEAGFTLLKWNGKYSGDAKFVVRDDHSGQQSILTPGRTQDLVWTKTSLADGEGMKDWEDFQNEHVDNLDDVAF